MTMMMGGKVLGRGLRHGALLAEFPERSCKGWTARVSR